MSEQKVESVERALGLLECFSQETPTLSLAELAAQTGLYKSTILRLASSLERFHYLVRNRDGRFAVGHAAWRLGQLYRHHLDFEPYIRPELLALAKATGETASYYVREANLRVCLYRENSERAARHHLEEGTRLPLGVGATGALLKAYTEPENADGAAVRHCGYAVSLGERDPDIASIAVPLIDKTGTVHGALSVSGIITRFTNAKRKDVLALLRQSADKLRTVLPA